MTNGNAQGSPQDSGKTAGAGEPALNSTGARLSVAARNRLGIYFACLAALTFYVLIATWPVVDANHGDQFTTPMLFGYRLKASPDARLFITVVAAGALGSLVHCLTSFADYVGNRNLKRSWVWYLILRTPIGVALALLFYVVLRGGLIVPALPPASSDSGPSSHPWTLLNPFGLAAIAAMAGMFSRQATDKLSELFDTLFKTDESVERRDPLLNPTQPAISNTEPPRLKVNGPTQLAVNGRNFNKECTASINGQQREVRWESETRLTITLDREDVSKKGELRVIVSNPATAGGASAPLLVKVDPSK